MTSTHLIDAATTCRRPFFLDRLAAAVVAAAATVLLPTLATATEPAMTVLAPPPVDALVPSLELASGLDVSQSIVGHVVRVVDGQTVRLVEGHRTISVRLAGTEENAQPAVSLRRGQTLVVRLTEQLGPRRFVGEVEPSDAGAMHASGGDLAPAPADAQPLDDEEPWDFTGRRPLRVASYSVMR